MERDEKRTPKPGGRLIGFLTIMGKDSVILMLEESAGFLFILSLLIRTSGWLGTTLLLCSALLLFTGIGRAIVLMQRRAILREDKFPSFHLYWQEFMLFSIILFRSKDSISVYLTIICLIMIFCSVIYTLFKRR